MKNIFYIILIIQGITIFVLNLHLQDHTEWLAQLSVNSNYQDSAIQVLLEDADVEICYFEDHSIGKCYPDAPNN